MLETNKVVRKDIIRWFEPAEVDTYPNHSEWWGYRVMITMCRVLDAIV
jgi:hypothetical protein